MGGSGANMVLQVASIILTVFLVPLIKFIFSREVKKLEEADAENKKQILCIEERMNSNIGRIKDEMNDLKNDMPFIYVTREDFIRALDNVDRSFGSLSAKLDKLYDHLTRKGA
jgi:archaellum component FlaC